MATASIGVSASAQSRRAVSAAVIGNVLEWYDFGVYGFVAAIIGKNFFPGTDDVTQLLSAFLTFGLGFLARPVGGIIIGRMGDTHGRKTALMLTIFLMALGHGDDRRPADLRHDRLRRRRRCYCWRG